VGAAIAAIFPLDAGTAIAGMEEIAAIAAPTTAAPTKAARADAIGVRLAPARCAFRSDLLAAITEASLLASGVLLRAV
jgi:hypothetical protein